MRGGEWERIERGLKQRIRALNEFIHDIYHEQKILKDKVIPEEVIKSAIFYRPQCIGINPPRNVWCHITGTDLVRHGDGQIYVLEDNLRVPSGVSYVLENRDLMKRTFPQVFEGVRVRPVDDYPSKLLEMLEAIAPTGAWQKSQGPTVVVLTPGMYNSAYFEHSFLAQKMGVQLVEGRDLVVLDDFVWMRTTKGLRKVDVIYRRLDDDLIDPKAFDRIRCWVFPDSWAYIGRGTLRWRMLQKWRGRRQGSVRVRARHDSLLPGRGRSYRMSRRFWCWRDQDRQHVLQNLDKLVVKAANEAGGYGMLVGPHSTEAQREDFAGRIQAHPRTISRSRLWRYHACRHDRRSFLLKDATWICVLHFVWAGDFAARRPDAGGAAEGILVVNSSQGGGSKDTWVLADDGVEEVSDNGMTQSQVQGTQSQIQGMAQ